MPEPTQAPAIQAPPAVTKPIETETPTPMDVDIPSAAEATESPAPTPTTTAPKKKKKKASYKNMMKALTTASTEKKEPDALRQGLGGGQFSKVDKI